MDNGMQSRLIEPGHYFPGGQAVNPLGCGVRRGASAAQINPIPIKVNQG
jgi:hypothetical protein